MQTRLLSIVLTHVNKLNQLELNPALINSIKAQSDNSGFFILIVNNPEGKRNVDKAFKSYKGDLHVFKEILIVDALGVANVRNQILQIVKASKDFTHVTFIDGDDNISLTYIEILNRYLWRVLSFLVFTCRWYKKPEEYFIIYPEYAVHYVNWCYLWNIDYIREKDLTYPSTSNRIPEDEMLFAKLLQIKKEFRFINEPIYFYNQFNAGISKQDSADSRKLVEYLTSVPCKIKIIN